MQKIKQTSVFLAGLALMSKPASAMQIIPEEFILNSSVGACATTLNSERIITTTYEAATGQVTISTTVPNGSYTGFGWGQTMTNTEMVIFSASPGSGSSIEYYYSTGETTPSSDANLDSCYNSKVIQQVGGNTVFSVSRPLDCGTSSTYVIKLDTEIPLIAAFNPNSSNLSFHSSNYFQFTQ